MSRTALAAVLLVALGATACGGAPTATDEPHAVGGRVEQAGFVLEVVLPSETYAAADAIPVRTTLTWTGAPGAGRIWGSGMGPVTYGYQEIGGAGRSMGGVMTADCAMKEFPTGEPVIIPVGKSAGWSGDDPNAAFYAAWSRDPLLHLPSGHWQVRVGLGGMLAPCDANAPTLEAAVGPIDLFIR